MPPASPALAARLSGDIGAVGTRHCARSDLPVDSGAHAALAPAPSAEPPRAAAAAAAAAAETPVDQRRQQLLALRAKRDEAVRLGTTQLLGLLALEPAASALPWLQAGRGADDEEDAAEPPRPLPSEAKYWRPSGRVVGARVEAGAPAWQTFSPQPGGSRLGRAVRTASMVAAVA